MGAVTGASRLVASVVAAGALLSCKGTARVGGGRDADLTASDGGPSAAVAAPASAVDAAVPADEATAPPPGEELVVRARHLIEAIVDDDPSKAADIVYPRDGWLATRDAQDPGKDWEKQVADPFRRAVHALSRRRQTFDHAQAVSIELGRVMVQAAPQRHGWKKPLWTVTGSRVTFVADGHTRTLPIHEMVAWRGAWYVVRLR